MTDLCITCKFVRLHTDQQLLGPGGRSVRTSITHLLCQFSAPVPQIMGSNASLWPEVQATDWCGSYKHDNTDNAAAVRFSVNSGFSLHPGQGQYAEVEFDVGPALSADGSVP